MEATIEKPVFYFDKLESIPTSSFRLHENYLVDDTKIWTEDDYQNLDDDLRFEIIEGNLYMAPAPESFHQDSSRDIEFSLYTFIKRHKLGKIYDAPFDVYLDKTNIVQPDKVIIGNDKLHNIEKKGLVGAPDIAIEILSPGTKLKDLTIKKELYQKFLIPEYWIVDPGNKTVEIYVLDDKKEYRLYELASESGIVKSWFLKGYELEISEIFNF